MHLNLLPQKIAYEICVYISNLSRNVHSHHIVYRKIKIAIIVYAIS